MRGGDAPSTAPYISAMPVLPPMHSPKTAWRDIRAFFANRNRDHLLGGALALGITAVILVIFFLDAKVNTAPPATITYVDSWTADRTDAEIKADQEKDQAANEERARARQEQFKEIANSFGIE